MQLFEYLRIEHIKGEGKYMYGMIECKCELNLDLVSTYRMSFY